MRSNVNRSTRSPFSFMKELLRRIVENRVPDLAAGLAYYFMLALFPFLIFAVSILSVYISGEDALRLVAQYVPESAMAIIEKNIRSVLFAGRSGLLIAGALTTFWSASYATSALVHALNQAYDVEESRSFWAIRGMAVITTISLIGVLLVTLVLSVFGRTIGHFLGATFGLSPGLLLAWSGVRWGISFMIVTPVFIAMYYFAPNKRVTVKEILPGALFAAICWQLVSFAFSFYVSRFSHYSAIYGGLAGVIILMLWFYLTGMIMLIGGEINATLGFHTKQKG